MSLQSDMETCLTAMIDLDNFGQSIVVDDVTVVAIFSPPEKEPIGIDGLFLEKRMLYCKTDDVDAPVTGQEMEIDSGRWNVGPVETWAAFFGAECTRFLS